MRTLTWICAASAVFMAVWAGGCSASDPPSQNVGSSSVGNGSSSSGEGGGGASSSSSSGSNLGGFNPGTGGGGGAMGCTDIPPMPAGAEAVIAPQYANIYTVYDLGTIPGAPPGHLGGCVIDQNDPNKLLFAGDSEAPSGAIYSIGLKRGPCGHIIGFEGTAALVATTPYVDANLVYGPNNVLFYTEWPVNHISQILPGQSTPAITIDGATMGVNTGDSVSGFGFVPPWLAASGEPRTVTWSGGHWFHLTMSAGANQVYNLNNGQEVVALPGGPGGFAYIPQGSPGFSKPSLILSEWSVDKVATYEVDQAGDPILASRLEFFTAFPRPWGAYFESKTGDFLFLTWGSLPDRVYIVQGFALPPPPPPPPN